MREFTTERIFKPLGMHDTHFHDDHTHLVTNRSSAYEPNDEGELIVSIPVFDNAGATSLFTTVEDFVKWDRNFKEAKVGDAKLINKLLEPSVLSNGEEQSYALGISVGKYRGFSTLGHGGADAGYRSDFLRFPEQRLSVMVFCNSSTAGTGGLSRQIADIFLADQLASVDDGEAGKDEDPQIIEMSEQSLTAFTGAYFHPQRLNFRRILLKDGALVYHRGEDNESALAPIADNRFIMLDVGAEVLVWFKQAENGGLTMNVTVDGAKSLVHGPVEVTEPTQALLAELAGSCHSRELSADFRFYIEDGQLGMDIPRQENDLLIPLFGDAFTGIYGGFLEFTRNEKGRVAGLELTTGRVRKLTFSKR